MKNLLFLLLLAFVMNANGQVAVNTDGSLPDNSAMLEVKSSTKGFLPPRVALSSANSAAPVSSPVTGLLVYNTAGTGSPPNNVIPGYYYWNSMRWVPVSSPQGSSPGDMLYWNGTQWASIPIGGSYGQQLFFCDGIPAWGGCLPKLTTKVANFVTLTSASSGGDIINSGGIPLLGQGICYNTAPNPTLANYVLNDNSGLLSYTSNLTGLAPGTTYYIRAWATNSTGTSYGNEVSFNSWNGVISLSTEPVFQELAAGATSGGNITNDGGAVVYARGVCWSTSPDPTISDVKTTDGSGTGSYVSNMYGMTSNTIYFVRAYATNNSGTYYGNNMNFTTLSSSCPGGPSTVSYGGITYNTIQIGTQCWLKENLNIGNRVNIISNQTNNNVIEKYCYYDLESYCTTYGGLYQWDEMMQYVASQGVQGICPAGWHIPTDGEFTTLTSLLGGESIAGGKMKEAGLVHWINGNTGGINSSLFTALPGGCRSWDGYNYYQGYSATFWSSTQLDTSNAWRRDLDYSNDDATRNSVVKSIGYSVRCLKN